MRESGPTESLTPQDQALLADLGFGAEPRPQGAMVHSESLVAALVDRHGGVVAGDPAFGEEGALDPDALESVRRTGEPQTRIGPAPGAAAELAIYAYGAAGRSLRWALPEPIRALAHRRPGDVVVLAACPTGSRSLLEHACRAYGFTDLQSRVAAETVRTGSIRLASETLGIAYDTGRETLAAALKRAQVRRLPALVNRLVGLALGVMPSDDDGRLIGDLWGLDRRQAAVALLVADGADHGQVASALGLSVSVVKKSLKDVYQLLQVGSSASLARKLQEARGLAGMIAATGGEVEVTVAGAEPLRFVHRADGSRIAFSDYGPASGRPVLVAHSSMTSRVVGAALRRALQLQGFRPISIDRPGFGLSDEVAGQRAGAHDPFRTAAHDACLVMDHLKLGVVDVVARGAAQFVVALHRVAPERIGSVVLTNPDPPTRVSGGSPGLLATVKQLYRGNPEMIRAWAAMVATQVTLERVTRLLPAYLGDSPPDQAAARDPEVVREYFRAVRTFATGRYGGYVNEQTEFARGPDLAPIQGTEGWAVLVGAHDTMHDPARVLAYWREKLPDAAFVVAPDAGRMLTFSHPQLVVDTLLGRRAR